MAMLNATLLLALALAVVVFLVLGRIQDIRAGAERVIHATLTPEFAQLDQIKEQIGEIQTGIHSCAPTAILQQDIEAVSTQLAAINEGVGKISSAEPKEFAKDFLAELVNLAQERFKGSMSPASQ